ncbi:hypothetical protein C8R44DRAFT_973968 [Mycena epipterygia]|nr:hypothetical protein C8R44DRAFT_973968 [Mycena epipterygia]
MSRSHSRSGPSDGLYIEDNSSTLKEDRDTSALLSSATALPRQGSKKSALKSSGLLRLVSLILHLALVAIHLALIYIWAKELEHNLVFSLDHQKIVSLLITAITQTFGTIYSALLVFVTQTLAVRRDLKTDQTLTTTHDKAAAWAGIGSAVIYVWHQKAVPASLIGVLSVFFYLGNILVLHITTPALFSLQTFNSSRSVVIGTQGLPAWNLSAYNVSSIEADMLDRSSEDIQAYVKGSLYYLPYVSSGPTIGLQEGTLYDVPDPSTGIGNISVNATGFDINCASLPDMTAPFSSADSTWELHMPIGQAQILSTQPGIISVISDGPTIVLYSTIAILDSNGLRGSSVNLSPPMNTSVSTLQAFQCTQSLVNQTALVDVQSRNVIQVAPGFEKNSSTWLPSVASNDYNTTQNSFLDLVRPEFHHRQTLTQWFQYGRWYSVMPDSDFPLDWNVYPVISISVAALYLIQKLNLHPPNYSDAPENITLHDLENALSGLVASMFWILGHIPPTHQVNYSEYYENQTQLRSNTTVSETGSPFFLQRGNTTVTEMSTQARLDLSIIAVFAGLAASIAILLLSLPHSLFHGDGKKDEEDSPVDGTGLLHAIWLYRNHPELETLLEHVEQPTDDNLRRSGMVRTRLVGGRLRKQKSSESF